MKHLALFVCALAATALPSLAAAQSAPRRPPAAAPTPAPTPAPAPASAPASEGAQVVIHIIGERQQPYAFAVSGRSPLGYTFVDEARSFAPAVVGAVRSDPF